MRLQGLKPLFLNGIDVAAKAATYKAFDPFGFICEL